MGALQPTVFPGWTLDDNWSSVVFFPLFFGQGRQEVPLCVVRTCQGRGTVAAIDSPWATRWRMTHEAVTGHGGIWLPSGHVRRLCFCYCYSGKEGFHPAEKSLCDTFLSEIAGGINRVVWQRDIMFDSVSYGLHTEAPQGSRALRVTQMGLIAWGCPGAENIWCGI